MCWEGSFVLHAKSTSSFQNDMRVLGWATHLSQPTQWVMDSFSPVERKEVKQKSLKALENLGHKDLQLDEYESTSAYPFLLSLPNVCSGQIASEIIHPDDIEVRFSGTPTTSFLPPTQPPYLYLPLRLQDIGGLDPIISSLRESVIYPLLYPNLFSSSALLGAPKGVLLFGPPGCGKTMLAKALAKESGATFINIAASVLTNKWYGESNKLVAGLFSLARKTQPSIVFIDEIDSFLRERTKGDHEVTGMMKAEFMT